MASKSLIINAVGNVGENVGKKYQKSVTFINPAASNEVAGEFARRANALTTNVFNNAQVVKRMDVTEEEQSGPVTLTVGEYQEQHTWSEYLNSCHMGVTSATIEGGIRITLTQVSDSITEGDDVTLGTFDVTY